MLLTLFYFRAFGYLFQPVAFHFPVAIYFAVCVLPDGNSRLFSNVPAQLIAKIAVLCIDVCIRNEVHVLEYGSSYHGYKWLFGRVVMSYQFCAAVFNYVNYDVLLVVGSMLYTRHYAVKGMVLIHPAYLP